MQRTQRNANIPQASAEERVKKEGWASLFLVACILVLVAYPSSFANPGRPSVGGISSVNIKAPTEISVVDESATDELQKEALAKVLPVYTLGDDSISEAAEGISDLFGRIRLLKGNVIVSEQEIAMLQENLKVEIPFTVLTAIVTQLDVNLVEDGTKRLMGYIMDWGIVEDLDNFSSEEHEKGILMVSKTSGEEGTVAVKDIYDLKNLLGFIDRDAALLFTDLDNDHLFTIKVVARNFIQPNLEYDGVETQRRRQQELEKVSPVAVSMKRGEMIVREGERLTRGGSLILGAIYASERKAKLISAFSLGVLALSSLLMILLYAYKHHPVLVKDQKRLLLTIVTITIVVGLARTIASQEAVANVLIPAAVSPILIVLLLGVRASALAAAATGLMVGFATGYDLSLTVQSLVGGIVGIYSVRNVKRLRDLFGSGFMVAFANLIVIVSTGLIRESPPVEIARNSLWGVGGGGLTVLLTIALLPLLERFSPHASDIRQAKLGRLSNPLLVEMRSKAPGTYKQSLRVAELSEAAARAIEANPLLARVSSYYLDLGKMKRPSYFLENLVDHREDEHEKLSASMGSLIIINHVKDGVEMAYEHKLPSVFIDIIRQHHGTDMIFSSNERARGMGEEESKEVDYRYPGPKPKTREAGIIMLADSVGATSRNLTNPPPSRIASLVKKVVNNKFIAGQLDECNLTLRDIKKINEAFIHVLTDIFHLRSESEEDADMPAARPDGSRDKQSNLDQDKQEVLVESS